MSYKADLKALIEQLDENEKRIYFKHQARIDEDCLSWDDYRKECIEKGISIAEDCYDAPRTLKECLDFYIEIYIEDERLEEEARLYWAEFL